MRFALILFCVLVLTLPTSAQLISIHGGMAVPAGDFANPPSDGSVELGAKIGYWGGAAYLYQMGPIYLRASLFFTSCAEKQRSFSFAGTVIKFRHQFFVLTGGLEKQFFMRSSVRPVASLSGGLFVYKTNYIEENVEIESEIAAYNFKLGFSPGITLGGGIIFEVVEDLVQLRIETYYNAVFSGSKEGFLGFEGGGEKRDYPYRYDTDRMDYWTLALAFVFHPE